MNALDKFKLLKKRKRKKKKVITDSKINSLPKEISALNATKREISDQLRARFDILKWPRSRISTEISKAIWNSSLENSQIIKNKGLPSWMGQTSSHGTFLSPEETLFLMEAEMVIVEENGLPLSVQQAHDIIIHNELLQKQYLLYSYLARLGYRLKKYLPHPGKDCSVSSRDNVQKGKDKDKEFLPRKIKKSSSTKHLASEANIVRKPLTREMFLQGTDLEKPMSWSEWKKCRSSSSSCVFYPESAVVVDTNLDAFKSTVPLKLLPSNSLESDDLSPLVNQTNIHSINELQEILQINGPKEYREGLQEKSMKPLDCCYEIYLPETKSLSKKPDYCISITQSTDIPSFRQINAFCDSCPDINLLVAVFEQCYFNTYIVKSFNCWNETPTKWDRSLIS